VPLSTVTIVSAGLAACAEDLEDLDGALWRAVDLVLPTVVEPSVEAVEDVLPEEPPPEKSTTAAITATATTAAFGLTLVMFLLLSTATATQYLVWAVAAGFLINVWAAAVYNIAASILLTIVYDRWNNAPPWGWDRTKSSPFTHSEIIIAGIVWLTLAAVAIAGLWTARHESGADGARSEAETNPEVVPGATMAS